ncbi:MAG: hypothetical protein AB1817_05620 [Chloroflexota bacterium]
MTTPWNALLIEGLHRADEARAERDGTLETHLRNLKGKQSVRAALVVRSNGAVRADARGQVVTGEPTTILQTIANMDRRGLALLVTDA